MTLLSVNVNKIATLRNSRGQNQPDLVQFVGDLLKLGVRGITVHPRPDERHIKKNDVYELAQMLRAQKPNGGNSSQLVEFNIEGYPSPEFLDLIDEIRPHQCTLVPDPPEALTSNAGWNLTNSFNQLSKVLSQLRKSQVRSSIFIDPLKLDHIELKNLAKINPDRVELYTEAYAKNYGTPKGNATLETYVQCARSVSKLGVGLNAGHDLNQNNLKAFIDAIPETLEVSIGHALICEALYQGISTTISNYHDILDY